MFLAVLILKIKFEKCGRRKSGVPVFSLVFAVSVSCRRFIYMLYIFKRLFKSKQKNIRDRQFRKLETFGCKVRQGQAKNTEINGP